MAALLNFGKSKKPASKQKKSAKTERQAPATKAPAAEVVKKPVLAGASHLLGPHITEKATDLAQKNQYIFVAARGANKIDIARAVQNMYGVSVEGVRIVNVHAKAMHLGRTRGVKQGYKKAIVKIKEGQKIEILPT